MLDIVRHTALQFGRALVMPNLKEPVTTAERAVWYRQQIQSVTPSTVDFTPLMSLYLTPTTTPEEVALAKQAGVVAVKWYPLVRRHYLTTVYRIGPVWMLSVQLWLTATCCC